VVFGHRYRMGATMKTASYVPWRAARPVPDLRPYCSLCQLAISRDSVEVVVKASTGR
jgi:hypothetical protein